MGSRLCLFPTGLLTLLTAALLALAPVAAKSAETTRQAGVLTKVAIALITQNPWDAFFLNAGADAAISGEADLKNIAKDAVFTAVTQGFKVGDTSFAGATNWTKNALNVPSVYDPVTGARTAGYFSGTSLQNIAVDAGTNSLSQTAFYGGSLKDNLGNSLQSGLINEGTGFAQNFVGDIKGADGSPIGVIGHGIVGCISADLSGGNCGRGAVNAAAGEIATAWADKAYGQDRDKVKDLIGNTVNPILAAATSGGDLGQFSTNRGISDSQLQNNYLFHAEAERKSALLDREKELGCSSGSATAECRTIRAELTEIEGLDRQRDQALVDACRQGSYSPGCVNERRKAKLAYNSYLDAGYNPTIGEYDYNIAVEYLDVAEQYGLASSEAMSESARAALLQIPVDTATGLLVLSDVSANALAGDPEARAQLWAVAAATKSLVLHPVDTVKAGIKRDLDLADQLEAEGKYFEADKLRSKTILNLQLSVTGAGGAATGLVKGGVKAVATVGDLSDLDNLLDFGKSDINPLEIREAIEATNNKAANAAYLYRGDGRHADQVFDEGLRPWDANGNLSLEDHVNTNPSPQINNPWVSTSRNSKIAASSDFSGPGRNVYVIENNAPNQVDVNETLGVDNVYYSYEDEVAIKGGIDSCYIKGCHTVGPDGMLGDFVPNPNYTGD